MTAKPRSKSDAFEAIHSAVDGMYRAGTIDKATMRSFDDTCLAVPPQLLPEEITALRVHVTKSANPASRAIHDG